MRTVAVAKPATIRLLPGRSVLARVKKFKAAFASPKASAALPASAMASASEGLRDIRRMAARNSAAPAGSAIIGAAGAAWSRASSALSSTACANTPDDKASAQNIPAPRNIVTFIRPYWDADCRTQSMFTQCSDKRLPKADEMTVRGPRNLGVVLPIQKTRHIDAAFAITALVIFITGARETA